MTTAPPNGSIIAEFTYTHIWSNDADELLFGRKVCVTGIGHVPRPLDGDGRTVLEPSEGVLLGLTPGVPLWRIEGADLWDAFTRALAEGRAIHIDNPDHVRVRQLVRLLPDKPRPTAADSGRPQRL